MIIIKGLTKRFKNLTAVDNMNLEIKENSTFALLGLNGAGKTTLINMLSTLTVPTSGTAEINGFDLLKDKVKIREILNISPQETAIAKKLTVRENLETFAILYGIKNKKQRANELIEQFGLQKKADCVTKTLSGGQMRRLSIALALINNPKILFLDEPTLGLDVKARRNLWEIIETLKSKMTIILTTHYLEEVESLADDIAIISGGKIKINGTKQEILEKSISNSLEDAFLKLTEEE